MSSGESPDYYDELLYLLSSSDEENLSQPDSDREIVLPRPRPPPPQVPTNVPPAEEKKMSIVFEKYIEYEGTNFFVSINGYHGENEESKIPYDIKIYQDKTKKNLISAMTYEYNVKYSNNSELLPEMKHSVYKILHTSKRHWTHSTGLLPAYYVYSRLETDIKTIGGHIEFQLPKELLDENYLFEANMVYPLCKDNEYDSHFFYSNLLVEVYVPKGSAGINEIKELLILNYIVSLIMVIKEKYNGNKELFEETLKVLKNNLYDKYLIAVNVNLENVKKMINKKQNILSKKFTSVFELIDYDNIRRSIKSILEGDDEDKNEFIKNTDEFICLLKDLINYEVENNEIITINKELHRDEDKRSYFFHVKKYYDKAEELFRNSMKEYMSSWAADNHEFKYTFSNINSHSGNGNDIEWTTNPTR